MRGYRKLDESSRLEFIVALKDEIGTTQISSVKGKTSSLFFGAGNENAELIVRQFLITSVLGFKFNKKLLEAYGKGNSCISHPLPVEWRRVLEKHGIRANTNRNKIEWGWKILLSLLFGITVYTRLFFYNLKQSITSFFPKVKGSYTYFQGLQDKNLPLSNEGNNSYDIFSWYAGWHGKPKNLEGLYHSIRGAKQTRVDNIPVISIPSAIAPSGSFVHNIKYAVWGIKAVILAFFDLFRSRYQHALLFGESAKSAQIRLLTNKELAHDYCFPNSNWLYRPLWTYDAAKKGARIIFYFYSTNIENIKCKNGQNIQPYHWQIINWPKYLVWDEWQADFIRRSVGKDANIEVTGPIWFIPGKQMQLTIPENSVAVFDINPLRDSLYHQFIESPKYLIPAVINTFLSDIHEVVSNAKLTMMLKRKRDIGNLLNKRNKKLVDTLSKSEYFLAVDIETHANQLIEGAKMAISLPFTSTALLAREMGKPACFYDPSGLVQKDDTAAHGITVINGKEELKAWVEAVLNAEKRG